ncbi:MAG TPA: rhomboid family intramembrane serine protease [Verrucomicrobiae bacterium]|nr:rhomboid family intramembrane serine protease [Verrucomicrobiae bacterium]
MREILAGKEWHRMITAAFLHADAAHLILNMVTLYLFGSLIEQHLGPARFLAIYFAAVIGGNLLPLWMHRQHEYRAYGASGGVCGLVFAFILLFPGASLSLFMLPIWIPGWLYGLLYLGGSIYAMRRQLGNIGHEAHIGGALAGLWITAAMQRSAVQENRMLFAALSAVGVVLILYLLRNPLMLPLEAFRRTSSSPLTRKPSKPQKESAEVDAILDKISREGIHSLTAEEQAILNGVSKKIRSRAESRRPQSDLII